MPCYRPLDAWQLEGGEIVFKERGRILRPLTLPCGRCIGCRQVRQRSWALRCLHESQMHRQSSFVTLTYDDAHFSPSLNYSDFQGFMHRLRSEVRYKRNSAAANNSVRFFACGEYGDINLRPHFHAILFGYQPTDGVPCGKDIFSSKVLSRLWPFGFSSFGGVSYQSASYVAGYCLKKVSNNARSADLYSKRYSRVDPRTGELVTVEPEMGRMSLKPGIGYSWFQKYWREVYLARDGCVLKGGTQVPAPRYYDKLLESLDSDLSDQVFYNRYVNADRFLADTTPERLAVREFIAVHNSHSKRGKV